MDEDQYLTPEDLCNWLKVRKDWVYDSCQQNKIPHIRIGRMLRFRVGDIREWLVEIQK